MSDNQDFDTVSILAVPRTGTNYLCSLIGKLKEINSFYEIFHKEAVFIAKNHVVTKKIIKLINNKYNFNITKINDPVLVDFVHQNPKDFIEMIRENSKAKYISFKIFPNHLTQEQLNNVIIKNSRIKKIIVRRNLLDAYISAKFAEKVQKFTEVNTSGMMLDFNEKDFMSWFSKKQNFYLYVEHELRANSQEIVYLDYEKIHNCPSDKEKFIFMFRFLREVGLSLDTSNLLNLDEQFQKSKSKQDKRNSVLEKINNPENLINILKKYNIEYLLDDL